MSLHADLLEQAEHLTGLDPNNPKEANLRRAVSSAYYALFHLLTSEASALYTREPGLAARINRTFKHEEMKKASTMVATNKLPKNLQAPGDVDSFSDDLKIVAQAFVSLQEARHEADYNLARTFTHPEVLDYVRLAREAFASWDRVKGQDEARIYLACLHLWERWNKDSR